MPGTPGTLSLESPISDCTSITSVRGRGGPSHQPSPVSGIEPSPEWKLALALTFREIGEDLSDIARDAAID